MIVFSVYNFRKMVRGNWGGSKGFTEGKLEYKYYHFKKGLFLGCDAPKNIDFTIKPEKKVDRFFKWLGVSEELQIGEQDVDREIYFATENRSIIDAVKQSKQLQQAFLEVINLCNQKGLKLRRLNCQGGRIWLQLSQNKLFKDFDFSIEEIAETFIPVLKNITDELDTKITLSARVRDPFLIRAVAILSVSTGSLFYAMSFFLAHIYLKSPQLITLKPLIIDAAIIGLGMVVIMSIITINLLGKTSRAHLVLIEIILIGSFSFTTSAAFLMMDINSEYDFSKSHFTNVRVYSKRITYGRRAPTKYLLNLGNGRQKYDEVRVSASFYSQINIHDILCSEEKDGFMGYRWIKNISSQKCYN